MFAQCEPILHMSLVVRLLASRVRVEKKESPPSLGSGTNLNPCIEVLVLDLDSRAKVRFWEGVRHPKPPNLSIGLYLYYLD